MHADGKWEERRGEAAAGCQGCCRTWWETASFPLPPEVPRLIVCANHSKLLGPGEAGDICHDWNRTRVLCADCATNKEQAPHSPESGWEPVLNLAHKRLGEGKSTRLHKTPRENASMHGKAWRRKMMAAGMHAAPETTTKGERQAMGSGRERRPSWHSHGRKDATRRKRGPAPSEVADKAVQGHHKRQACFLHPGCQR